MVHLIITVLAIALMGSLAVAGVSYINPEAVRTLQWQGRLDAGVIRVTEGFESYRLANTTFVRGENINGEGVVTEYWYDEVFTPATDISDHMFFPAAPGNTTWTFEEQAGGYYFCLSGEYPSDVRHAALRLANFHGDEYILNSTCGAYASSVPSGDQLALTVWVKPPSS